MVFPETLIASKFVRMADGAIAGIATVGREGMLGLTSVMNPGQEVVSAMACVGGTASVLSGEALSGVLDATPGFSVSLLRYASLLIAQLGQVAACSRLHDARSRLARWLLLVDDRLETPGVEVTQEMMSFVLGVRRPSVTIAAAELQKATCIHYARGRLEVIDRERLLRWSCECYAPMRATLRASLGGGR